MRFRSLIMLAVVLAACGGTDGDAGAVTTTASSTSTLPGTTASTAAPSGETTTTVAPANDGSTTTRPAPNPDRELAPDFSLTLSDGTEYQLANETRPVYMVFWAEW